MAFGQVWLQTEVALRDALVRVGATSAGKVRRLLRSVLAILGRTRGVRVFLARFLYAPPAWKRLTHSTSGS